MRLTISNDDEAIDDVFHTLKQHTIDPYEQGDILRTALRWAEIAQSASQYARPQNQKSLCANVRFDSCAVD